MFLCLPTSQVIRENTDCLDQLTNALYILGPISGRVGPGGNFRAYEPKVRGTNNGKLT